MAHIIRTAQQIQKANNNFARRLQQLLLVSYEEGAEPSSMAADIYNTIVEALCNQAEDEDFIEQTIANFSSTLREAVQTFKDIEKANDINGK